MLLLDRREVGGPIRIRRHGEMVRTPTSTIEGACAKVRKDGSFTIQAEFGRVSTFSDGVSVGP